MPERENVPSLPDFKAALGASLDKAAQLLASVHPADAADWLQDTDPDDAWRVFRALDTEARAELLGYADEGLRSVLIARLSSSDLKELVEELPSDEAVDVLAEADDRIAEDVLHSIPTELATGLRELSAYPAESAGGVMATEFVMVPTEMRVGDLVKAIRKEGEDADEDMGVFVIDARGCPVGYVSDRDLLTHSIHTPVDEVMVDPFTVDAQEDQEEAANLIAKYNLQTLAVVDAEGVMQGVISFDDAQEILESEVSEDFMRLVGTAPILQTRLPVLTRVRQRLPLMAVTVAGGLLSARILGEFQDADSGSGAAILRYLPLIIGLAGNVGIQSSTILVRGFATGEVEPQRERAVLTAEIQVGVLIGLLCGGVTALIASWMEPGQLGGAVGIAVAVAVAWAAMLGGLVPVACRRLGIDPAIVAGPFLICLSDISGSAIYVAVARTLLPSTAG
ncbi:MAG: magnesium transporter [Chlamydiales bacterium]|jgi:magnesium transporter